ncbi:MAG: hypothetical protein KAW12_21765 [Candidatus Aminicenantes bacterium]|nr:hypothetical protein [Candidatus Aminicenantes bacterium]
MDKKITLKVDGKKIPVNPFVSEIFSNVINGLVDTLKKVPEGKNKIEILVEN